MVRQEVQYETKTLKELSCPNFYKNWMVDWDFFGKSLASKLVGIKLWVPQNSNKMHFLAAVAFQDANAGSKKDAGYVENSSASGELTIDTLMDSVLQGSSGRQRAWKNKKSLLIYDFGTDSPKQIKSLLFIHKEWFEKVHNCWLRLWWHSSSQ